MLYVLYCILNVLFIFTKDIPLVDDFLKMKLKIDRVDRYQFVSQFPIEGLNQLWVSAYMLKDIRLNL